MRLVTPIVDDLAHERRPSRARSLVAAVVVGVTAGALTYRVLRSVPEASSEDA
jgi:hypothetical protein